MNSPNMPESSVHDSNLPLAPVLALTQSEGLPDEDHPVSISKPVRDVENSKNKSQKCCRRNMRIILVIFGVFLLLLSVLGAAIYFLFPRIPRVNVVSADAVKGVTLEISSENYIDYTVNSIKGHGIYQGEVLVTIDKGVFVIKAREKTIVHIPIHISSPLPRSAVEKCLMDSDVPVHVKCEIDLKIISWTGKKIPINMDVPVPCPEASKRALSMARQYGVVSLDQLRKYGDLQELARQYGIETD